MYGYICIGFIDFMLKSQSLLDYTHYSITKRVRWKKSIECKISCIFEKTFAFAITCSKGKNQVEKTIFKKEESIEILKILGLSENV